MFRSKRSDLNMANAPKQVGIVPASTFISKLKRCNDVALQMAGGIAPMIALLPRSNLFNADNDPYEGGIEPEIIVLL
jgi:hypothetical protein